MQAEQLLDGSDAKGTVGARIEAARVEAILLSNDPRHAGAPAMLMKAAGDLPAEEIDLARQLLCSALRAAVGLAEPPAAHRCAKSRRLCCRAATPAGPRHPWICFMKG